MPAKGPRIAVSDPHVNAFLHPQDPCLRVHLTRSNPGACPSSEGTTQELCHKVNRFGFKTPSCFSHFHSALGSCQEILYKLKRTEHMEEWLDPCSGNQEPRLLSVCALCKD